MQKFRGQIQIGFRYSEHLGARFETAGVTLRLESAENYKFESTARWETENYTSAVERGIKDGLIESEIDPELGIHITLQEINYDSINSSEHSFYISAKCAVKSRFIISENRVQ